MYRPGVLPKCVYTEGDSLLLLLLPVEESLLGTLGL
jgi:hypothetical protein